MMYQRKKLTLWWTIGSILIVLICFSTQVFGQYAVGDKVSDFTLSSLSGEEISLSDFHEQVILLNFFTTW